MKNKKNQTLPLFVFFFFCVITMSLYGGESTAKTDQSSLQARRKILNKPKKPASLARQEDNNKSPEEKIMQWFFERGIHPGDPESIQRNLENKGKEKILGRFKLKDLSAPTTDKNHTSSLLARRKDAPFSIQLIKVICSPKHEELINPE